MRPDLTTAKPLAPEDLKPDLHVAPLFIFTEHITLMELLGCDEAWNRRGVIRTRWLPREDIGLPLRIVEVCLPFVLLERPDGKFITFDTRRVKLAALSEEFARKAAKRLKTHSTPPKPTPVE